MLFLPPQRMETHTGKRVFVIRMKEGLIARWQRRTESAESFRFFFVERFGGCQAASARGLVFPGQ
jgi:hypothetical protein